MTTPLTETYRIKISSDIICSDIFNPKGEIFLINTQKASLYLNRLFTEHNLTLADNFIETINFKIVLDRPLDSNADYVNLEFIIGLELFEE